MRPGRKGGDLGQQALDAAPELFRVVSQAFPGSTRSFCVQLLSPQEVAFTASALDFTVDSTAGEGWVIGFCPKGPLQGWP